MVDYRQFRLSKLNTPEFSHVKLLLFWPIYLIAFFAAERLIPRDSYNIMYHPIDDLIPFNEWFLIPYLFWFVFMVGSVAYTFFYEPEAFRRLMKAMILTFSSAVVVFLIFPTCQELRPQSFDRDNLLTRFMAAFYQFDTSTNVCPSLHVSGSLICAFGLADTKRFSSWKWKAAGFGIAVLISISTVFVKQHSVVDVFWGAVQALIVWVIVYIIPRMRKKA